MSTVQLVATGVAAASVAIMASFFMKKSPVFPSQLVADMVSNRRGKEVPLSKMTIIVTGATNGLGKMICAQLYSMGVTVIIASRSPSKCLETIAEIKSKYPDSVGTLKSGIIDTSDLDSVKNFVKQFLAENSELHALVNNAGIHYVSTAGDPINNLSLEMKSKQGYDLAFATNYLGHFLLTELLLPILSKTSSFGTVVNVASTYHFLGDGVMLTPPSGKQGLDAMPPAARSDINHNFIHREFSYGNNKLAQVLHAKELQRRFTAAKSSIRIVSVCPGWVDTGILPNNAAGKVVGKLAFSVQEGILSAMCGLFDSSLKGGEFLGNSVYYLSRQQYLMDFIYRYNLTRQLSGLMGFWLLLAQKHSYGKCYIEPSSPYSLDENLAKVLYDWSKEEVAPYVQEVLHLNAKL